MAETTCWLVVEPEWSRSGAERLRGIRVNRVTQNRPGRPAGAVIKLRVVIPDEVFAPFAPDVTIEIPPSAVHYEPQVTVELPERISDAPA